MTPTSHPPSHAAGPVPQSQSQHSIPPPNNQHFGTGDASRHLFPYTLYAIPAASVHQPAMYHPAPAQGDNAPMILATQQPDLPKPPQNAWPPDMSFMKYKCSVCGRFRSARYHYKHPLLPGQLPKKTICRKCRQNATDSESRETDSYEEKHQSYTQRRGRTRSKQPSSRSKQKGSRRHRSTEEALDSAGSDAISSASDNPASRCRGRSRRRQISDCDVVRYVEERHVPPRIKTIYINEPRSAAGVIYYDDGDEVTIRRSRSRLQTPGPGILRNHNVPGPTMPVPNHHEPPQEQFDGARSIEEYAPFFVPGTLTDRQTQRRYSFMTSKSHPNYCTPDVGSAYDRQCDTRGRSRRVSSRFKELSRSRSRHSDRHDTRAPSSTSSSDRGHPLPRAPSPPPRQPRTSRHSARHKKRYDRARDWGHGPRGSDEVTVFERGGSGIVDDYDWYDPGGMRVRVREI